MNGSGKYKPWLIDEENLQKYGKKRDVFTVQIILPPEEPEEPIEVEPEMETFEWLTMQGKTQQIKVDKQTLSKLSHPKIYICSLCDRTFVSIELDAKCPWCSGKAIFLQGM